MGFDILALIVPIILILVVVVIFLSFVPLGLWISAISAGCKGQYLLSGGDAPAPSTGGQNYSSFDQSAESRDECQRESAGITSAFRWSCGQCSRRAYCGA